METIEELKQQNEKLTERLNNAAKFFREQKAQIDTLTKENEDLNNQCKKLVSDIDSKDKAYKILQDTYNEVFAEKEKISNQFKEQEKFESNVINTKVPELETKLKNAEDAYEELRKKYKENDVARGEAELRLENIQNEYKEKFEEQKIQIDTLQKSIKEKDEDIKTRQNDYEIVLQQLKNAEENREDFRSQLVDLEKKYDQLDKLYDTCEAEKLSAQADCDQLQEKIKYIEENNISDKEWQNHLEDVITQIRNLADDVINPKPAVGENKENIMKRTGDYNVAGENVGV